MQIEFLDINKSFKGKFIINNFSLKLPKRGNICFFGKSGCGKSTLLNLLAGIEKVDSGEIKGINGSKISYAFQDDRLLPWISAIDNINLVSKDKKGEKLLEQMELNDAKDKKPDELSGGMRKRVNVARALSYDAEILLLDEPFAGLDDKIKDKVMDILQYKVKTDLKILVSHNKNDALLFADKVYLMDGPPLKILNEINIDIPYEEKKANKEILKELELQFLQGK